MTELQKLEELRSQQRNLAAQIAAIEANSRREASVRLDEIRIKVLDLIKEANEIANLNQIPFRIDLDSLDVTAQYDRVVMGPGWDSSSAYC